ncbi:Extracellular ribonuclease precursor [Salinivirga cyanobacteriivorans]|uniref:Extracellular ribonuclease n=1 Tax=Salinivirga cyanobacteriivorans TaxID=1307839 RepID=A0A0S2I529_9BACT|nr:endonuclease [Salinivirga cyanobacteriivorans]ALO17307.1 Extracellular ribonuclease precursor [Salinivirga cyanobacteriivorans]
MKQLYLFVTLFFVTFIAGAQVPDTYYDGISGTGYTLKTNLHNLIDGHNSQSYDALWTHMQSTDNDGVYEGDNTVLDMYSENPAGADPYNFTWGTDQCGNYSGEGSCYNREHSFPKSWFSDASPMYTDLFHLYPTDGYVNGQRGNYPFGNVGTADWTSQNGSKKGSCAHANYAGTVFEPIDEFKGDFARTYFYMATRYEDVITGWSSDVLDGSADKVYVDWYLETMIQWHQNDPVSQKELDRNDAVYDIQGNANPFIDHPEWVCEIWSSFCGPNIAASPTSLTGFSYEEGSGPSTSQSFELSGTNLDGSQVAITAPTNYEVSTDNSSFSASVNVSYTAPTLSSTTIYVRLKAGLSIASYNGENVTCSDDGSASDVTITNSGTVTATSLFCDDFEDNLNDWTVTNDADPDAYLEISSTFGGANSSTNVALFTTPNPGSTTYYTSSIEKTFLNSQNLSVNFWYFFEDYRGGEVNIYINGTKFYGIATEGGGDIAISETDDDLWTELSLDLSGLTSTVDDYTIKIEGISKSASSWKDRVAIDDLCVYGTTVSGPTLTVSRSTLSGFTYEEGSGPSTVQSFTLSGSDLDNSDVTLTAPTNYKISTSDFAATDPITLSSYDGTETTIYVRLKSGLSTATYNSETISIAGGGDTDGAIVTCSGDVTAAGGGGSCANELIFSEYVEGSSSNKYIEIANFTGGSVDLSDYEVRLYSNGNTTASQTEVLSGTLADKDVYVIGNADGTLYTEDITSNVTWFNGDDAVELYNTSTGLTVDIIGCIGEDPGSAWTSGSHSTANQTLVRKSSVTSGVISNPASGFPTLESEWDSYSEDENSYLGSHTMTCASTPTITLSTSSFTGFTYEEGSGPSSVQTFTISGSDLDGTDVTLTAPTNYEISTSDFSAASPITLSSFDGSETTIYVRLKSGLSTATYNSETISISGGGDTDGASVSCSGEVTAAGGGGGSSTIVDFETAGDLYTPSTTDGSGNTDVFNRTDEGVGTNSTYYWAVEDMAVTDPFIDIDQIDVTGGTSFTFSIDMLTPNSEDWDVVDELLISYSVDGGAYQNLMWVQSNDDGDDFNAPAALDLDFDGTGDDGQELPAVSDNFGAGVGSDFETFSTSDIALSGNSTLDIKLQFIGLDANAEGIYLDNITIDVAGGSSIPILAVSSSTLTNLDYFSGSGPSTEQTFTLSGSDLDGSNVTLTPPANFEISKSSGSGFVSNPSSLTYSSYDGSDQTIYVRLAGGLGVNTYSGDITISGGGDADGETVSLSGEISYSAESDIIAVASSESATVSSIENTTGPLNSSQGVQVWQITIRDGGAGGDADAASTIVNGITISQNTNNGMDDWDEAILSADLFDGTTHLGTATITNTQLQFSASPLVSVSDNASKTLTLRISISTTPNTSGNNVDGDDFVFEVTNANVTADAGGSGFSSFSSIASDDAQNVFDIDATEIQFAQQPTNTMETLSMDPAPAVKACDANGNVDIDYTADITLESTGTMTGDPITKSVSSGRVIFDVVHEALATGLEITATPNTGLSAITSNTFDITELLCTDLMISEYMEGTGDDKAIELFNGTGSAIDLSNYQLRQDNGNDGTFERILDLTGTLSHGNLFLVIHVDASTEMKNAISAENIDLETDNTMIEFGGDDPVGLFKSDGAKAFVLLDVVGDGTNFETVNLNRNADVFAPNSTFTISEWTETANTYNDLGSTDNPLPVTWKSVSAVVKDKCIDINWTTATETNNDYFSIEHSIDNDSFQQIGRVEGAGNASVLNYYSFRHNSPVSGENYYRIKQVDFNGNFDYSKIVSAKWEGLSISRLNIEFVHWSTDEQKALIQSVPGSTIDIVIYNLAGKKVYKESVKTTSAYYMHSIEKTYLQDGIYIMRVRSGENVARQKFAVSGF